MLVPIKTFTASKLRLAPVLGPGERAELARAMAERVLAAAGALPVSVVCEDHGVAAWSSERGASVIRVPPRGLDHAVEEGVRALAAEGYRKVVVCHADLPLADDLAWVADFDGVTLVPDRRGGGTNVACVPASAGFCFAYGPSSCFRHASEARRLGLAVRVVEHPFLGWDVDVPEDLPVSPPASP